MGPDDLSRAEGRFQIALSTIFCTSISAFGAFLVVVGIIQWANGEVIPVGGIAIALLGRPWATFSECARSGVSLSVRASGLAVDIDTVAFDLFHALIGTEHERPTGHEGGPSPSGLILEPARRWIIDGSRSKEERCDVH